MRESEITQGERKVGCAVGFHLFSPLTKAFRHELIRPLPVSFIALNQPRGDQDINITRNVRLANLYASGRGLSSAASQKSWLESKRFFDEVVDK